MGYINCSALCIKRRGIVAQSVARLTEESEVPDLRNPGRDISFPIFIRKEIETRELERKLKQKILVSSTYYIV